MRSYVAKLNNVFCIGVERAHNRNGSFLSGVCLTLHEGSVVYIDGQSHWTYQKKEDESAYFLIYLDGKWVDKYSDEAKEIFYRHYVEDNT